METKLAEQKETQIQQANKVTDFSLGIFGTSDNFIMAMQMAKALSQSTIVPREYQGNSSNSLIAIEMAQRLNTSPFLVMQNLDVIQGRPSWSAKYLIAMINASGKYDFELQYEEKQKDGKPFSCQCWTEKDGRRVDGIVIDMDMAKKEGWLDKNGSKWKTMPQVMLRYRAASFFSRMNCPEITLGLYTKEELIDGNFTDIIPVEDIAEQVKEDLKNANTVDFEEASQESETVVEETEQKKEEEKETDIPDFMKAE